MEQTTAKITIARDKVAVLRMAAAFSAHPKYTDKPQMAAVSINIAKGGLKATNGDVFLVAANVFDPLDFATLDSEVVNICFKSLKRTTRTVDIDLSDLTAPVVSEYSAKGLLIHTYKTQCIEGGFPTAAKLMALEEVTPSGAVNLNFKEMCTIANAAGGRQDVTFLDRNIIRMMPVKDCFVFMGYGNV